MEDIVLKSLNSSNIKIDITTIVKMAIALLLTIAVYIVLVIAQKRVKARLLQNKEIKRAHAYTTGFRIAKFLTIVGGVIAILQCLGVNLVGLTALIGLLVVIFVLAVRDALEDVFAGFMIMTDKYFAVGDAVEFEGRDGIVVFFTVRSTKIEFLDDRSVLSVANRNISKIRRLTHLVDIDLPVSYDLSRGEVVPVLTKICDQIRLLEGVESCELKGTQDFADSAIIYKIRFFCEPNDRPDIRREVLRTIQEGLEAADIHVPYPQLDIHEK